MNNNATIVRGQPRPLSSFTLDQGFYLVEGLIVDATTGGIGLRNHTVPLGTPLGAQWEEDILWIEPVTACAATNLSFHFSISSDNFYSTTNGYMRNDGGFSILGTPVPTPRWDDDDNQNNWRVIAAVPDLQNRANVAAWWNNYFVAQQLGINSSETGQIFDTQFQNYGGAASPSSIIISGMDGTFLDNNFYSTPTSNEADFEAYGELVLS